MQTIHYIIYLFEASFCLMILFLVYYFFFRKETYFRFNRFYLLGSMIFSLTIPMVHIQLSVEDNHEYASPVQDIGQFRTYYEELINWLDPDWETTAIYSDQIDFEEGQWQLKDEDFEPEVYKKQENSLEDRFMASETRISRWHLVHWILLVYIVGVGFFVVRLAFLFVWLFKLIKTQPVLRKDGYKIVQLQGDVPPFSFLGYVFVNQSAVSNNDLQQVLAHEKVHIRQKHSLDLLLAHGISVLLWFNPFAWLLQKAIKTTHEYLADRKVVDQGYELFDYQSLLLSQLISIRSVELVNNFNLISIKKRINMMTKNKSGLGSKMKAMVIIPFAVALFFVFSDFTIKGSSSIIANYYDHEVLLENAQLNGLWKSKQANNREEYLLFKGNILQVLEKGNILKEFQYNFKDDKLLLKSRHNQVIPLKYKKTTNELTIWWSAQSASTFVKTAHTNSLDARLNALNINLSLPELSHTRILDNEKLCLDVFADNSKLLIAGKNTSYSNLRSAISKQKSKFHALDLHLVTVRFFVDENTSMEKVDKIRHALRQEGLFKVAYVGKTDENKVPFLLAHAAALPQKLPPLDAKIFSIEKLKKSGMNVLQFGMDDIKNYKAEVFEKQLKDFIQKNDKYIMYLEYDKSVKYGTIIAIYNSIYDVIYALRDNEAKKLYKMSFEDIASEHQKAIKKKYPIMLTQANLDMD